MNYNFDNITFDSLCMALDILSRHKAFPKGYEEQWRDISGYEGLYQVSNYGRVKSHVSKPSIVLLPDESALYWRYTLSNYGKTKRFSAHRLLADVFIPNPHKKPCINHKSGFKKHNCPTNLEWVTFSENTRHALETGLMKPVKGLSGNRNAKSKPVLQLSLNGIPIKQWDSANLAAISLELNPSSIGCVCRGGRKKSHGGFLWKFIK